MTLNDWAALGTLVSSVAVLISLIYLARQIRQAERQSRAAMDHNRATRIIDINFRMSEPETASLTHKARLTPDALEAREIGRHLTLCRTYSYNAEDIFLRRQDGMLSEAGYSSFFNNFRGFLAAEGPRAAWRTARENYDLRFVAMMDRLVDEARAMGIGGAALWQAALAEERAIATAQGDTRS